MPRIETIRESVVIRIDFVEAGAARPSRTTEGGATIIDFAEVRQKKAALGPTPSLPRRPTRPFGGRPGGFGGPF